MSIVVSEGEHQLTCTRLALLQNLRLFGTLSLWILESASALFASYMTLPADAGHMLN